MLVKRAVTDQEINDVFRLRYQVYCLERGYEDPFYFPSGLEIDEYDPYSIHLIAYEKSLPVGTARIILPNPVGLPVERYCNVDAKQLCDVARTSEVSRLAVSAEAVRQASLKRHEITLELIREACQTAGELGMKYFFAAMAISLERLLNRLGIEFLKAGPAVNYHGLRTPYFGVVEDVREKIFSQVDNLVAASI